MPPGKLRSDANVASCTQTDEQNVLIMAPLFQQQYNEPAAKEVLQALTCLFSATGTRYLQEFLSLLRGDSGIHSFANSAAMGKSLEAFYHFRQALLEGNIQLEEIGPVFAGKKGQRKEETGEAEFFSFFSFLKANLNSKRNLACFALLFGVNISWQEFAKKIKLKEDMTENYRRFRSAVLKDPSLWPEKINPCLETCRDLLYQTWKIQVPLCAPAYELEVAENLVGHLKEVLKNCPFLDLKFLNFFLAGEIGTGVLQEQLGQTLDVTGFSHLRRALLKGDINLSAIHSSCSIVSVAPLPETADSPDFVSFMKTVEEVFRSSEAMVELSNLLVGNSTLLEVCTVLDTGTRILYTTGLHRDYTTFRKACLSDSELENKVIAYINGQSSAHLLLDENHAAKLHSGEDNSQEPSQHAPTLAPGIVFDVESEEEALPTQAEKIKPTEENDRLSTPSPILLDDAITDGLNNAVQESIQKIMHIAAGRNWEKERTEPPEAKSAAGPSSFKFDFNIVKQFENIFSPRFEKLTSDTQIIAKRCLVKFVEGSIDAKDFVTASKIPWGNANQNNIAKTLATCQPHVQSAVFQRKFHLSKLHRTLGDIEVDVSGKKLILPSSVHQSHEKDESIASQSITVQRYSLEYKAHCKILVSQPAVSVRREFLVISASDSYLFLSETIRIPDNLVDSFPILCAPWGEKQIKVELPDGLYPAKKNRVIVQEITIYEEFEEKFLNLSNLHQSFVIISAEKFEEFCLEFERKKHLEIGVQIKSGTNSVFHSSLKKVFGTDLSDFVCNALIGQIFKENYLVLVGRTYLLFLPLTQTVQKQKLWSWIQFGVEFIVSKCTTVKGESLMKVKVTSGIHHLMCPRKQSDILALSRQQSPFVVAAGEDFRTFQNILLGARSSQQYSYQREIICVASAGLYLRKKPVQVLLIYLKPIPGAETDELIFKFPAVKNLLKFDCFSIVTEGCLHKFLDQSYEGCNTLQMFKTDQADLVRSVFQFSQKEQWLLTRVLVNKSSTSAMASIFQTENIFTQVKTLNIMAANRKASGQDFIVNWRSHFGLEVADHFHTEIAVDQTEKELLLSSPSTLSESLSTSAQSSPGGKFNTSFLLKSLPCFVNLFLLTKILVRYWYLGTFLVYLY